LSLLFTIRCVAHVDHPLFAFIDFYFRDAFLHMEKSHFHCPEFRGIKIS